MYEFLADELWWKHHREINDAFDKVEVTYTMGGYEVTYLPDITWVEVQSIQVPKTIVYNADLKPVYVIVGRNFPLSCWIKIKDTNETSQTNP
jgi:hypothetical protein